ncbi:olfactory receptor 10J4-like [Rhinophrynus dorsalis]
MQNSTNSHPLVLTLGFGEMTEIKFLYSAIVLICFTMIVLTNGAVITVIVLHRSLHEPMYIFICALCINGLYGSIGFFPILFVNLLCKTQTISYIGCITQVFCIHTYIGGEMALLSVMGIDRYVCICNPLRYNNIMPLSTVFKLIAGAWLYTVMLITILIILTITIPLCDSNIQKIYCDNWSVVKLSCVDTTVNNIYGLLITATFLGVMPVVILLSYIQILRVCSRSSKDFRAKALQTCTPHLIALINLVADALFEVFLHRFPPKQLPYELKITMSVQAFVVAPLLNPLIYGLKMKEIRIKSFQVFCTNRITAQKTIYR